jgi:hypothetical protein
MNVEMNASTSLRVRGSKLSLQNGEQFVGRGGHSLTAIPNSSELLVFGGYTYSAVSELQDPRQSRTHGISSLVLVDNCIYKIHLGWSTSKGANISFDPHI